jgi:hypothetical protein
MGGVSVVLMQVVGCVLSSEVWCWGGPVCSRMLRCLRLRCRRLFCRNVFDDDDDDDDDDDGGGGDDGDDDDVNDDDDDYGKLLIQALPRAQIVQRSERRETVGAQRVQHLSHAL